MSNKQILIRTDTVLETDVDQKSDEFKLTQDTQSRLSKVTKGLDAVLGPLICRYLNVSAAKRPKFEPGSRYNKITQKRSWRIALEIESEISSDIFENSDSSAKSAISSVMAEVISLVEEIGKVTNEVVNLTFDPKHKGLPTYLYSCDRMVIECVWLYVNKCDDVGGLQLFIGDDEFTTPIMKIKNSWYEDVDDVVLKGEISRMDDSRRLMSIKKDGDAGYSENLECSYKPVHRDPLAKGYANNEQVKLIGKALRRRIQLAHRPSAKYVIVDIIGSKNMRQEQGDLDLPPANDDMQ